MTRPDYLPLLAGASYVEAIPFDGRIDDPAAALAWAKKNYPHDDITVSHVENNPDSRRLTPSYQLEAWRLAGALDEFGKWPLVLEHDGEPAAQAMAEIGVPPIAVALNGISSPWGYGDALWGALSTALPNAMLVDVTHLRLKSPQDLIPLFNVARCLVTVDTMHLHLARAARVPVVAILQDREPWFGSVPSPSVVARFNYKEATANLGPVIEAVRRVISARDDIPIVHARDRHGKSDRHKRAQAGWSAWYVASRASSAVNPWAGDPDPHRNAANTIGDPRPLPYFKDVLQAALTNASDHEVIFWTNDDVALLPGLAEWLRSHVALYGAAIMRRSDDHIGRDLFAFTAKWLRDNWDELPDYIIGTCDWDMGLAAMIRAKRGIVTCLGNVGIDFYPCDATERLYTHEEHPSEWNVPNVASVPSVRHNRECFRRWAERYCPGIKFYPDGLLR